MTQKKKELAEKITQLSEEHWKASSEPLLLSQLGPDLTAAGFAYKETLDGEGLRHFIDKEIDELTIAKHPQQYAKVGVYPAKESFSYAAASAEAKPEQTEVDKLRKSRRAFYGFIQAISELPPEEIEAINIPARVIVRLLEGK